MCQYFEPCGPFGPVPPNSRLSSLLWQSVQKICDPIDRPWVVPPVTSSMVVSKLGCGSPLLRVCITEWLDFALVFICRMTFKGSLAALAGMYPNTGFTAL